MSPMVWWVECAGTARKEAEAEAVEADTVAALVEEAVAAAEREVAALEVAERGVACLEGLMVLGKVSAVLLRAVLVAMLGMGGWVVALQDVEVAVVAETEEEA